MRQCPGDGLGACRKPERPAAAKVAAKSPASARTSARAGEDADRISRWRWPTSPFVLVGWICQDGAGSLALGARLFDIALHVPTSAVLFLSSPIR